MTVDDEPTGIAPTELGAVVAGTEAHTAWCLDDSEEWVVPRRQLTPGAITTLALAGSLAFICATAAFTFVYLRDHDDRNTAADQPAVTTSAPLPPLALASPSAVPTSVLPAPPPATVTVERTAAPKAVPVLITAIDEQFLANLTSKWGFTIPDPAVAIQNAAMVCKRLRSGVDLPEISREMANATEYDVQAAHIFASEVLLTYPTCHMP